MGVEDMILSPEIPYLQQVERARICKGPSYFGSTKRPCQYYDRDSQTCTLCGCPVDEKTKYRDAECPEKKW